MKPEKCSDCSRSLSGLRSRRGRCPYCYNKYLKSPEFIPAEVRGIAMGPTKVCTWCKEEKARSAFRLKAGKQGERGYVNSHCIECEPKYHNARYIENKNSGVIKRHHLSWKFKMSVEDYDLMFESQGGCCAICGVHQDNLSKALVVDHDHNCCPDVPTCGKCSRSLLCDACNTSLGFVKEDESILRSMIRYIQHWHNGHPG